METNRKIYLISDSNLYRAVNPGGIRLGTPAVTTRGMVESDMETIAAFLLRGIEISKKIQARVGKQLKDFLPALEEDEEIKQVGEEVKAFSTRFSIPGI